MSPWLQSHISIKDRVGGGLTLLFRDNLDVKHTTTYDFASMECSDFRINLQNCIVNLAIIYRLPDRSVLQFALDILDYMEHNINTTGSPVITGDLNIKMNDKEDASTNTMLDILDSLDLVNHVNFPTHRSQNTLDLVITRNSDNIVRNPSQGQLFLDHNMVMFDLVSTNTKASLKEINYQKIKSIDCDKLQNDIACLLKDHNLGALTASDCHQPVQWDH